MIYLASPYSHPDPFIREARYLAAAKALTQLLTERKWAYSPIVHCHELAKIVSFPKDAAFWEAYNFYMLRRSSSMFILMHEGWDKSVGIAAEKEEAELHNIPVSYYAPQYTD